MVQAPVCGLFRACDDTRMRGRPARPAEPLCLRGRPSGGQGFGRRAILAWEARLAGFYGCIPYKGAHSRQSEPCNLVRTAPWKALTSPSRTTVRGANGRTKSLVRQVSAKRREAHTVFKEWRLLVVEGGPARAAAVARMQMALISTWEAYHSVLIVGSLEPLLLVALR
jgi:hypothetical protein